MDNQELLRILFALKNELPLKKCSTQEKVIILFPFVFSSPIISFLKENRRDDHTFCSSVKRKA